MVASIGLLDIRSQNYDFQIAITSLFCIQFRSGLWQIAVLYYKALVFGGYFYLVLLAVKTKIAKIEDPEKVF